MNQVKSFNYIDIFERKCTGNKIKIKLKHKISDIQPPKNQLRSQKVELSNSRPKPPEISHKGIVLPNQQGLILDSMKTGLGEKKG